MQVKIRSLNWNAIIKGSLLLLLAAGCLYMGDAFAQGGTDEGISGIAKRVTGLTSTLANMMIAISYIAGIGFVLASLFKFKQHKDNPTQIPLGTPLAMLVIGIILVFLPAIFKPVGESIFGKGATPGAELPGQIQKN